MGSLTSKLKEVSFSVLPVGVIVLLLHFFVSPLEIQQLLRFFIGMAMIIAGLALLLFGVDIGITPVGSMMGRVLTKSNKHLIVIAGGLLLGFFISVAEPDLHILAQQVESVTLGMLPKFALVITVSLGIAFAIALGFVRILHSLPLYLKKHGISGGTVLLAQGTAEGKLLNFFELSDIRKEIVLMTAQAHVAQSALDALNEAFRFKKKGHGIAFITPVCNVLGTSRCQCCDMPIIEEENIMYQSITTIVDKGRAEQIIEAATKAGARGGTIINARGSGIHETSKLFAIEIEPEKEVVLIIAKLKDTDAIVATIREMLHIDEPGKGILFVQNLSQAVGLY